MDHIYAMQFVLEQVVCPKHREWLKNFNQVQAFVNRLLTETLSDSLFKEFCKSQSDDGKTLEMTSAGQIFREVFPLCCFLGEQRTGRIRDEVLKTLAEPILSQGKPRLPIEDKAYHPIELLRLLGWKQIYVSTDEALAKAYGKGWADARKKTWEVALLVISDPTTPAERQFEVWAKKLEG